MVPVIDGKKTIGIVFLPGAMTGMILAGDDRLAAAPGRLFTRHQL